jgi:toxin HigB-1
MTWSPIIDISWSDHQLEKCCASDKSGRRKWGAKTWTLLKRRLIALEAAPSLADMEGVPGRCHQLTSDRRGQFAVRLGGAQRLVFSPDHDPVPTLDDGGIDRANVTKIVVHEVVDYHGR